MKTRTVFQSTKVALNSATDIVVASAETLADTVNLGRDIISLNLRLMKAETIRDNHIENAQDVEENLNIVDDQLDRLEALLEDKTLTARQKKRIQLRIAMWEDVSAVVESTKRI